MISNTLPMLQDGQDADEGSVDNELEKEAGFQKSKTGGDRVRTRGRREVTARALSGASDHGGVEAAYNDHKV
jgi:hypothetical protein